jgi:hypothetical protein
VVHAIELFKFFTLILRNRLGLEPFD